MSVAPALGPHFSMPSDQAERADYRLILASLGNFLHDLERAREAFRDADGIGGLPVNTWQDADHLYVEGVFRTRVDSGREIDVHVVEGKFFIRLARH